MVFFELLDDQYMISMNVRQVQWYCAMFDDHCHNFRAWVLCTSEMLCLCTWWSIPACQHAAILSRPTPRWTTKCHPGFVQDSETKIQGYTKTFKTPPTLFLGFRVASCVTLLYYIVFKPIEKKFKLKISNLDELSCTVHLVMLLRFPIF